MKKHNKKIFALTAVLVLMALSILPSFAEQVGFKFTGNQLLEMGQGLDAQKTLSKDNTYNIMCITAWDQVGDDQLQYFVYFCSSTDSLNTQTSSGLTTAGGTLAVNNALGYIWRAEYNTSSTGGYLTQQYVGIGTYTLRSNEIIVAYKDTGWRINTNNATNNYIGTIVAQPNTRYAFTSYNQALMGFNGQYENSIANSFDEGYASGYVKGKDEGYDTGYADAYNYYERVITERENNAFDLGYDIGYYDGFSEGVGGDVKAYELPIQKIITAIPESVRLMIDNSLDGLSVGGIALGSFAIGILVLGLIVTVVLWLWKEFK